MAIRTIKQWACGVCPSCVKAVMTAALEGTYDD